jgi:outer membrane protein assembly factor BamE
MYGEAAILGNFDLTFLDFGIVEFFDQTALQTYQMVMMSGARKLKNRFATFEMVALKQPRLFELRQHPVDGGETDIFALTNQGLVNILCRKVPYSTALEQAQYSKTWEGGLQTHGFKIVRLAHSDVHPVSYLLYDITLSLLWKPYAAAMRAKILTLLVLLLLAGCSSVPSLLYKIEIQQGNVITQEMVDKLKPGMTRSQVRFALGSPMISDAFHDNRWDYVYRLEQKGRLVEQRKLTVFFEDDKLVRTDGSFSPSVAFARPQSVESPKSAESASPVEPVLPVVKEESSVPASSGIAGTSEALTPGSDSPSLTQPSQAAILPAPVEPIKPVIQKESAITAVNGTPGISAGSSALSKPGIPPVRQLPSQAADAGGRDADQPKE